MCRRKYRHGDHPHRRSNTCLTLSTIWRSRPLAVVFTRETFCENTMPLPPQSTSATTTLTRPIAPADPSRDAVTAISKSTVDASLCPLYIEKYSCLLSAPSFIESFAAAIALAEPTSDSFTNVSRSMDHPQWDRVGSAKSAVTVQLSHLIGQANCVVTH